MFRTKIFVDPYLCERPFLRWAKSHKRSRINKKWHKRYGAIFGTCPGKAYQMSDFFYCCPCIKAQLDKEVRSL